MEKQRKYLILKNICEKFNLEGEVVSITSFGNGKINKSFKVICEKDGRQKFYILQCISDKMGSPNVLMNNTKNIISHLEGKGYRGLNLVNTKNGNCYIEQNKFFRVFEFLDGEVFETIDCPHRFEKAGEAFAKFAKNLQDINDSNLVSLMPDFHNTSKIFEDFVKAVREDPLGRKKIARDEIWFLLYKSNILNEFEKLRLNCELPKRIIHGDTKLNNLIFYKNSHDVLAVVDYDTVMKNYLCYDFGDAVRSGCNCVSEDEANFSKVKFNLSYFNAFSKGYLDVWKHELSESELESIAISPFLVTYELSLRFLTDYLMGDIYFLTKSQDDNLVRCKNQVALLKDMYRYKDKIFDSVLKNIKSRNKKNKTQKYSFEI